MKNLKTIVTLAFIQLFFLTAATAQTKPNVTKDAQGNYIALSTSKKGSKAKDTGKTPTPTQTAKNIRFMNL